MQLGRCETAPTNLHIHASRITSRVKQASPVKRPLELAVGGVRDRGADVAALRRVRRHVQDKVGAAHAGAAISGHVVLLSDRRLSTRLRRNT